MALNDFPGSSLRAQTSERWLRFYEAYWASGEQDWMRDALHTTVWPRGWLSAVSAVNDRLCVWSPWSPRGYCGDPWQPAGYRAAAPASIWHGSWRSRRFPRRKLCRANKIPMIISLHSFLWDYHHFAGNWSDVLTAQQSSRCLLFVKYCSTLPLPFIHIQTSFILEAFPGCVFCLPRLSSVWFQPEPGQEGGYETQAERLSPPDPLPLLLSWLDSSTEWTPEHGKHLNGLGIRFTVNGPLMCGEYSERMLKWGDGESSVIFSSGFHSRGLSPSQAWLR